jgi:hypothetical protein
MCSDGMLFGSAVLRHYTVSCWIYRFARPGVRWGSWGRAPFYLNLETAWRWVVNVTPRSLCPAYRAQVSVRRLGSPRSRSARLGEEEENLWPVSIIELGLLGLFEFLAKSLYRLRYCGRLNGLDCMRRKWSRVGDAPIDLFVTKHSSRSFMFSLFVIFLVFFCRLSSSRLYFHCFVVHFHVLFRAYSLFFLIFWACWMQRVIYILFLCLPLLIVYLVAFFSPHFRILFFPALLSHFLCFNISLSLLF